MQRIQFPDILLFHLFEHPVIFRKALFDALLLCGRIVMIFYIGVPDGIRFVTLLILGHPEADPIRIIGIYGLFVFVFDFEAVSVRFCIPVRNMQCLFSVLIPFGPSYLIAILVVQCQVIIAAIGQFHRYRNIKIILKSAVIGNGKLIKVHIALTVQISFQAARLIFDQKAYVKIGVYISSLLHLINGVVPPGVVRIQAAVVFKKVRSFDLAALRAQPIGTGSFQESGYLCVGLQKDGFLS